MPSRQNVPNCQSVVHSGDDQMYLHLSLPKSTGRRCNSSLDHSSRGPACSGHGRARIRNLSGTVARAQNDDFDDLSRPRCDLTRRAIAASLALPSCTWLLSQPAEAISLPSLDTPRMSPQPIRIPRNRLNQQLAVLLMRSVYDAVDSLDFVSMSDFQANFWKFRQSQYEPYTLQYSPVRIKQGDLQDANYFDFITFAQVATVGQAISSGKQVFEEFCEECPDQKKVVMRNAKYKDNASLPGAVEQIAGDNIYRGLRDGFRGKEFGAPQQQSAGTHINKLAGDVQQILDILVQNGYALKAKVANVSETCSEGSCEYRGAHGSRGSFQVKLEGPANLWGMAALANRGSSLHTAYSALAVDGYLRESNVDARYTVAHTPTAVTHSWTLA